MDEPARRMDPADDTVRVATCDCCGKSLRYTDRNMNRLTDLVLAQDWDGTPALDIGAAARTGVDLTDPGLSETDLRRVVVTAVSAVDA
jgi:hypothetical protein